MMYVTIDTRQVEKMLANARKQIPYAAAESLNVLAFQVKDAENAAMKSIFKHPREFTQRAVLKRDVKKATRSNLVAVVSVRPEVAQYLAPYEFGGKHYTPGKGLLKPVDARVDPYGQLPRGLAARLKKRPDVFVGTVTIKGEQITGFWQRPPRGTRRRGGKGTKGKLNSIAGAKTGLKLLIRIGNPGPVNKRLGFRARGIKVVSENAPRAMEAAVTHALRTARP